MTNPAYEATNSDVEKVEKKKYPSDNYLNEILTNTEFAAVVPIEAVRCMARELMLLRTSAPNGMMQLSNELAEMKRKQKPAYDVTAFGQFSACDVGGELHTAITQFIFDGNPANRKGEMVPKFMLQGVINSLQEHCDKMGDESMIVIMVGAGGTVAGGE